MSITEQVFKYLKKGNVFLDASAGTGKTYSIVEILKKILEDKDSDLDKIAVITFTEKAAGELSVRIREALESQKQTSHLEKLPQANIGTIHQFCRNLLLRNPEGSDFFFLKQEERSIASYVRKAFYEFLEKKEAQAITQKKEEEFINFFYNFEVSVLENFVLDIIQKAKGQKISTNILLEQEILNHLTSLCKQIQKKVRNSNLSKILKEENINLQTIDKLIKNNFLTKDNQLNKKINSDIKDHVNFETWSNTFSEIGNQKNDLEFQKHINEIISFTNEFLDYYENYKLEENFLSTDDIIQVTKKMLLIPEVRKKISSEFDYIIVDECQDTDPEQFAILELISTPAKKNSKVPKLIFVGDKKQSIYKFRDVDLELVLEKISKLVPKANTIVLDTSYRGTHNLTKGFNLIFGKLKSNTFDYKEVKAGRDDIVAKSTQPAIYLTCLEESQEITSDQAREISYKKIADFINYINGNKNFLIYDKNKKKDRVSRFSDIAVLSYSRRELDNLQQVLLSYKIPCSIYKEKNYYDETIVSELSYILHSIENPDDSTSLFFALQSRFFLISNKVLSELSKNNILSYNIELPNQPKLSEITNIFKAFKKAHTERFLYSASFILQRLFEEFESIPRVASGFEGRKNLTNLYHYYQILDELQYNNFYSFGDLAREMKKRVENHIEGEKKIDFEDSDTNQDAVRLLTVHSAKGLEFPICVMASLFRNQNYQKEKVYTNLKNSTPDKKVIEFSLDTTLPLQTANYKKISQTEKQKIEDEENRLFYVSLTRARDYLFLPLIFPQDIKRLSSFSKKVYEIFQDKNFLKELLDKKIVEFFRENSILKQTTEIQLQPIFQHKINNKKLIDKIPEYKKIEEISSYKIVSYSSLKLKSKTTLPDEELKNENQSTSSEKNYSSGIGMEFGKACHKVLELFPFELISKPKYLEIKLKEICEEVYLESGIITQDLEYSINKLFEISKKALLYSYPIQNQKVKISQWKYISKEKKFYSDGENLGDFITGVGDVLFYYNKKFYILDWKTDREIKETNLYKHTLTEYQTQAYLYSWILTKNLVLQKGNFNLENWEKIYTNDYGGMLFVYVRYLDKNESVIFLKPSQKEILDFLK